MAGTSSFLATNTCKLSREKGCTSSGALCCTGSSSNALKQLHCSRYALVGTSSAHSGLAAKFRCRIAECSLRGDRVYAHSAGGFFSRAVAGRKSVGRHIDSFRETCFNPTSNRLFNITGATRAGKNCCDAVAATSFDSSSAETAAEGHVSDAVRKQLVLAVMRKVLPVVVIGVGILIGGHSVSAEVAGDASLSASGGVSGGLTNLFQGREVLASAWTGLVAGGLHTLTGPDHLAALAPLCIGRSGLECAAVGALWGCGHDAGQIIFGLIFLMLKDRLHIELIRTWSARVVGVTLMIIGAMGLKEAQEIPAFSSVVTGANGESGIDSSSSEMLTDGKKSVGLTTFGTGIVYGLQPDALLMILPALALPSRLAGAAFLSMFLLGTVVAMGSYTAFIGSCSEALRKRIPWITRRLTEASSMIAVGLGLAILLGEVFGINIF